MAMDTSPRLYRRLRKTSDISIATTVSSSSKRMRTKEEHSSCCEDKISSLPEEILIMILDKLDARTTITTTILSKRWLDLPRRSHTFYDLSIYDILPPRYHRLKKIAMETKAIYEAAKRTQNLIDICDKYDRYNAIKDLNEQWMWKVHLRTRILQRYERLAMRCYVKRVNAFLLPPDNVQRRSFQKLRLQTFWRPGLDEWFTAAVGRWGVEDLEIVVESRCKQFGFYPLDRCQNVRLKRLLLSNFCHYYGTPPLFFQRLTTITLCKGSSHPHLVYDILRDCLQLVDLRLRDSPYSHAPLHVNFPNSRLKNLQVDNCDIFKIYLTSVPCLETFACRGQPTKLRYGEVPRLRHMWLKPTTIISRLTNLKKLFIANVPVDWDTFWIFILFAAAPYLQSLHVHFDNNLEKVSAAGSLDVQVEQPQHHHLRELVVIGFDGVAWQTGFVKRIMRASRRLGRVHLLDGHVVEDEEQELAGLEILPHRREWHECERLEVLEELTDGTGFPVHKIVLE
nr:putative RGA-like protein [Triticum aestivum]